MQKSLISEEWVFAMKTRYSHILILTALIALCLVAVSVADEARDYAFAYNLFQERAYKMARDQFEKVVTTDR